MKAINDEISVVITRRLGPEEPFGLEHTKPNGSWFAEQKQRLVNAGFDLTFSNPSFGHVLMVLASNSISERGPSTEEQKSGDALLNIPVQSQLLLCKSIAHRLAKLRRRLQINEKCCPLAYIASVRKQLPQVLL